VQPSSVPARRTPGAPREARVSELDPGEAAARWEEIVIAIRDARPALGAVLEHATPLRLGVGVGGRFELVLGFPPNSFYAKQADAPQARDEIAKTAHRILGMPVDVRIVECAEGAAGRPTVAELEAERQRARREAARKEALSHPMVVEALAVFGTPADAVEVRIEGD
jgi:DNA polymerase-3 subunit gamma/tau